jgi:hypothetical protein
MKKLLLISFLFTAFSSAQAQKNEFIFGVGAGINIANITDKFDGGTFTPDARVGFKGYIFFDVPVTQVFAIQPELGYDGLGFKYTDPGSSQTYSAQINYLTVSVLPKFKVKGTGLSFIFGPSLGLLLNANVSDSHGNSGGVTNNYNSVDLFAVAGAQYFLPVGLGFSARYMGGLTNIAKGTLGDETVHNNAWTFTIAYRIKSR